MTKGKTDAETQGPTNATADYREALTALLCRVREETEGVEDFRSKVQTLLNMPKKDVIRTEAILSGQVNFMSLL